jgi:prevent-host-death family protein|tara:strand:- start:3169 stop:3450 length:282 start_codon:yes stop_codon:yes gene_type:complete
MSKEKTKDYGCNEFITIADARNELAEIINRVAYGKEWVGLTRRGKPLVVLIPIEDAGWIEDLQNEQDTIDIEKALLEKESSIPLNKVSEEWSE